MAALCPRKLSMTLVHSSAGRGRGGVVVTGICEGFNHWLGGGCGTGPWTGREGGVLSSVGRAIVSPIAKAPRLCGERVC